MLELNSIQFWFNPSISKQSLMVTQPRKYMQKGAHWYPVSENNKEKINNNADRVDIKVYYAGGNMH